MKKRWISLCVLVLALVCVFVLPATAKAAQDGNYTYEVASNEATVTGYTGADSEITIPSTLGGYPVTAIGDYAFFLNEDLTAVAIADSVTGIGQEAFSGCSGLTAVTIGNGVRSIGDRAFFECTSLVSVAIPDSVTTIGSFAFSGCGKLTEATIGNGVTEIGAYGFSNCSRLKTLTLGNQLTTIGSNAFYGCSKLTAVTIPDSVTAIGTQAFYDCDGLSSVTIGNGVTVIGKLAFSKCDKLASVDLGDSVTTIAEQAFADCDSLNSVRIPKSVTAIGDFAFRSCDALDGFLVEPDNANYSSDDYAMLFDKNKTTLIQAPAKISGAYTVPDGVTEICDFAFAGCEELTAVTFPDSVTTIGAEAFAGCFRLRSVTLGNGVADIGQKVFDRCYGLTGIWVKEDNPQFSNDARGVLFDKEKTKLLLAPKGISGGYTVPETVTVIEASAFEDCYSLTAVTVGNRVTTISERAFYYCDSMALVVLPGSVTTIGQNAFYDCRSLANIYYAGSETQWKKIQIAEGNSLLTGAAMDYNYVCTKLEIVAQPVNVAAEKGKRVKITVKAAGDGLTYSWYYKRTGAAKYTKAASVKNVLSVEMAEKWDGCKVYCTVTDQYGNSVNTEQAMLYMGAPVKITTQPKNRAAEAGQRTKVTVKATGDGLTYSWYYKRTGAAKYTKAASVKNVLSVEMAKKWDGCKVYCTVTDQYGTTVKSDVVTLHMGAPAKITTQPKSVKIALGQRGKVTLKAAGDGLTYNWYYLRKNNTKYTKAASVKNVLSVEMAKKWDGCKVYCVVKDQYGTSVKSAVVTLKMR